jgi:tetratricopeptide (TPR) repeat protein
VPPEGPAINAPLTNAPPGPPAKLLPAGIQRMPAVTEAAVEELHLTIDRYPRTSFGTDSIDVLLQFNDGIARPIDLSSTMWPAAAEDIDSDAELPETGPYPVTASDAAAAIPVSLVPHAEESHRAEPSATAGSLASEETYDTPLAPSRPADVEWQRDSSLAAVSLQAETLLDGAFALADKGALYSARAQFFQTLETITKALDAHCGTTRYSNALAEGRQALREAQDFADSDSSRATPVDIAAVAARHRTPVCRDAVAATAPAIAVMQRYFAYAEERFTTASAGAPVASRAFYGLGKTYQVQAEQTPTASRLSSPQAMVFQKTALAIDSRNHQAANELGVMLARFGQLPEARAALLQSVATSPMAETWHNLAVVHERLGEQDLARLARNEQQLLQQAAAVPARPNAARPVVQWVDPAAFASSPEPGLSARTPAAVPAPRAAAATHGNWTR